MRENSRCLVETGARCARLFTCHEENTSNALDFGDFFIIICGMSKLEHQIQSVIQDTRQIFRAATGPRLRIAYWRANNIHARHEWLYCMSAEDIIENAIPARVAGRVGQAKVFCKMAAARGLDCYVVCSADYYDWLDAAHGDDRGIRGRVMMAVRDNGRMRIFDPFCGPRPVWYDCATRPGNFIQPLRYQLPYLICAIVPRDEFLQCDSYEKMRNLYASGDMSCSEFKIKPEI